MPDRYEVEHVSVGQLQEGDYIAEQGRILCVLDIDELERFVKLETRCEESEDESISTFPKNSPCFRFTVPPTFPDPEDAHVLDTLDILRHIRSMKGLPSSQYLQKLVSSCRKLISALHDDLLTYQAAEMMNREYPETSWRYDEAKQITNERGEYIAINPGNETYRAALDQDTKSDWCDDPRDAYREAQKHA